MQIAAAILPVLIPVILCLVIIGFVNFRRRRGRRGSRPGMKTDRFPRRSPEGDPSSTWTGEGGRWEEESIYLRSERLQATNDFTRRLAAIFDEGHWAVSELPFGVRFIGKNTLGRIDGMHVRFDVYMNGVPCGTFEKSVSRIREHRDIEFEMIMNDNREYLREIEKEYNIPTSGIRSFDVKVRSFELCIPRANPLYFEDEVRDAAGLPRVERRASAAEDFARLAGELPEAFEKDAKAIVLNLERAESIGEKDPEAKPRVDRFCEKYIRTINRILRNYSRREGRAGEVGQRELLHTLNMVRKGTETLVRDLTEFADADDAITLSIIEQQLVQEGLYNPLRDGEKE